jgi:hypothetical protein
MDRIGRRSLVASLLIHGLVIAVVVTPPLWRRRMLPPDQRHPAPAAPVPRQRLILAPSPPPPAPPLPGLAPAAQPGWASLGQERELAEVVTPHDAGVQHQHSDGDARAGTAPVRLPEITSEAVERAARFDGRRWSNRELTDEQERLQDMRTLLERLMRDRFEASWRNLRGPVTTPVLYLTITVDGRGQVIQASRINSSGSTGLDLAIDRWLHDQASPVGLPAIDPGVPHVLKVTLYDR